MPEVMIVFGLIVAILSVPGLLRLGTQRFATIRTSAYAHTPAPAVIEPTLQEVDKFLSLKLYDIRAAGAKNGDRHLLTEVPSKQAVTDLVRQEFGVRLTPEYAQRVLSLVEGFVNKGKAVTKGDLQYILESVLRGLSSPDGVLKVEDFQVKTTLHGKAEAKV